jgi:hypothetical protein
MSESSDYLADLSNTDLMRITIALATEVYELRDRLQGLEHLLQEQGVDLAALNAPVEPAAYDADRLAQRDSFVARVFAGLNTVE